MLSRISFDNLVNFVEAESWKLEPIPDLYYAFEEFTEATPYVAIYPPAILAQIVWAAALRHFYRW